MLATQETLWEQYFAQGEEMWRTGAALEALRRIQGREAKATLRVLGLLSDSERSDLPSLLLQRFLSTRAHAPQAIQPAEKTLLARFDSLRIEAYAADFVVGKPSPTLRKNVKRMFLEAAKEVFGQPGLVEAGDRTHTVVLGGSSWRPVVAVRGGVVSYWGELSLGDLSLPGLSVLCQLGLAGGTQWDLIASDSDLARAVPDATALWKEEVGRLARLST